MSLGKVLLTYLLGVVYVDGLRLLSNADAVMKDYNGKEILDPKRNYQLQWNVNWGEKTLEFTLTVRTVGWVGLGFSKDGSMKDSDFVIAGVLPNGQTYISDMFTDCHRVLKRDNDEDWNIVRAVEQNGTTILTISRLIDTCDEEDYTITEDLVHILWAYGEDDMVDYHHEQRGSYPLYLLDPVMHPPPKFSVLPKWRATQRITLPNRETTYWCTIHKAPRFPTKHHIVQLQPVLENKVAVNHTHHFVLYRCQAPEGVDPRPIFDPLVNYEGEECYFNLNSRIPVGMCLAMTYVWAMGGRPLILPDYVGIPFGRQLDEYYMLQVHYNNPESVGGIKFEAGVELMYTDRLRSKDGDVLMINYNLFGLFMIPPGTERLQVFTHCPEQCTREMFPEEGIDVFAIHTHTHGSGRKIKLHHYRNGQELPWIIKDDNYNYLFQTPRPLQRERKLLPGDHLMLDCIYDDSWTNETTVAAFGSLDEMCLQILYHTNPTPYSSCYSEIPRENLLPLVGVQNVTWNMVTQERVITAPFSLNGETLAQVTDFRTHWTQSLRERVAMEHIRSPQVVTCPNVTPSNQASLDQIVSFAQSFGQFQLLGTTANSIPPPVPLPPTFTAQRPSVPQYSRVRTCS